MEGSPIDRQNYRVESEGSVMSLILAPDRATLKNIIFRGVKAVVDTADDYKKPSNDGQDLVRPHGPHTMAVSLGERIN